MKEETKPGYEWVDCGNGGYWTKVRNKNTEKLDFFCPHCKKITGSIDDKFLRDYGICSECFVLYVEERSVPSIDLSKYKK